MSESSPDTKLTKVFSRTPSSWDPQDDLLLRHLKEQQKLGWKEIASHFAHRTPNACQFRWRRLRSGSLKTTNSPTPTSGADTPNTKTQESSSNSASPPQTSTTITSSSSSSSSKDQVPLVSKFSSKAKERKSSTPISTSLSSSSSSNLVSKTNADDVPGYKWSFNIEHNKNNNVSEQRKFKDSIVDPLNSTHYQDLDSDDEKNSSVLIEQADWTMDEDELLQSRRSRSLSFAELSILLPLRSEGEIISRIGELEREKPSSKIISTPKIKRSSSTTTRHSHPNPIHTPVHSSHMSPQHKSAFTRSYSSSSQTSLSRSNSTTSTNQFLMFQDSLRSKSFSYITPYTQSTDRYNLRKNSITNLITINQEYKSKTRSNSFLTNPRTRSNSFLKEANFQTASISGSASPIMGLSGHVLSNDRERLKRESSSSDVEEEELKIEPKLPPLGTIFNDLYSK
ncbi:hypothetical protein BN7_964 [Wickerhamomyces ciferrii]|uniref:Uncharacterized protein n=1 Tax=Wickerhamomyces ciferrii (strain ATCC 14091 / BCRC 22168 / CBS 111 / JCM 3599 / NBRC 0793 / NRRL Y-1031 F-60-10) TaxID=1206466 RepID=K0KJX9_WICCF|nr:uncharacterized protein BN7_964 [Wickerhamomyces ciferrii]CCH41423.1 hypothetical protein BN7_964 [Wickerhamomyces ciferrii]